MRKKAGVWIDHRNAVIVALSDQGEETIQIKSKFEKRVAARPPGVRAPTPMADDLRKSKFEEHLKSYYDEVIEHIRESDSILIFGPGDAKAGLKKRLERYRLGGRVVGLKTTGNMPGRQVALEVRKYFISTETPPLSGRRYRKKGRQV